MIIVCGGIKGGGGKTTTSTNLAVIFAMENRDVLFIDGDSVDNQTGSDFFNLRLDSIETGRANKLKLTNVQLSGKGILQELRKLNKKFDDIIVDVGGADSVTQRAAIAAADLLLIPVFPSSYDIWTLEKVSDMVEQIGAFNESLQAACFLSRADSIGSRNEEAAEAMSVYENLAFLDTPLRNRAAFRDSAGMGLSVVEHSPKDKKAIAEVMALRDSIRKLGQ